MIIYQDYEATKEAITGIQMQIDALNEEKERLEEHLSECIYQLRREGKF